MVLQLPPSHPLRHVNLSGCINLRQVVLVAQHAVKLDLNSCR